LLMLLRRMPQRVRGGRMLEASEQRDKEAEQRAKDGERA